MADGRLAGCYTQKKSRNFRFGSVNRRAISIIYLSMPTMAMSAAIMSTATMIETMSIVARIPMPIIAMAVVAGTEAEIKRRFDYHSRLVITIIDRRGITGRGDLGIN